MTTHASHINPTRASSLTRTPPSRKGEAPTTNEIQHHDTLKDLSQKVIAQTFYGQLLKQMHNSPFKSELLSGGRGGQVFTQMQDQQLSERMSQSSGSKLVNNLTRRLEGTELYKRIVAAKKAGKGKQSADGKDLTQTHTFGGRYASAR